MSTCAKRSLHPRCEVTSATKCVKAENPSRKTRTMYACGICGLRPARRFYVVVGWETGYIDAVMLKCLFLFVVEELRHFPHPLQHALRECVFGAQVHCDHASALSVEHLAHIRRGSRIAAQADHAGALALALLFGAAPRATRQPALLRAVVAAQAAARRAEKKGAGTVVEHVAHEVHEQDARVVLAVCTLQFV
eukprot:1582942-Rhodomonas_salina.1